MPPAPDHRPYAARAERTTSTRDLARSLPAGLSWWILVIFVAAFAVAFAALDLPSWMPAVYAVMSVLAFAAYGLDKSAARRDAPRVSEQTLLTVGLLCGWPGALVAQQVFRHKTRKRPFRRAFWRTVVLNVLLLVALLVLATVRGWDLQLPWLTELGLLVEL